MFAEQKLQYVNLRRLFIYFQAAGGRYYISTLRIFFSTPQQAPQTLFAEWILE